MCFAISFEKLHAVRIFFPQVFLKLLDGTLLPLRPLVSAPIREKRWNTDDSFQIRWERGLLLGLLYVCLG